MGWSEKEPFQNFFWQETICGHDKFSWNQYVNFSGLLFSKLYLL